MVFFSPTKSTHKIQLARSWPRVGHGLQIFDTSISRVEIWNCKGLSCRSFLATTNLNNMIWWLQVQLEWMNRIFFCDFWDFLFGNFPNCTLAKVKLMFWMRFLCHLFSVSVLFHHNRRQKSTGDHTRKRKELFVWQFTFSNVLHFRIFSVAKRCPWSHKPVSLNGRFGNSEIGGCKEIY